MDILFFKYAPNKESNKEIVTTYTPNSCEYEKNGESEEYHTVSFYNFGEAPASHFDLWKEWDRKNNLQFSIGLQNLK